MAAQRAGVKHVFIPYENMDDLDDVADEVKEKLEITPVRPCRRFWITVYSLHGNRLWKSC